MITPGDGGPARSASATSPGCTALVLSGGGARAAYQVGVLHGLLEHGFLAGERSAFQIFVGSSAGSLNAAALASSAHDFRDGLERLASLWREIQPTDVFRTDPVSLGRIGARWIVDLSLGGATGRVRAKSLLDTAPLRRLLATRLPFAGIEENVRKGIVRAVAIMATDLHTSNGVVFLHARADVPSWARRRWNIERTRIGVDHLMASSAIPIFFPFVRMNGRYYGDGSIRNTAPLSPAINLGADRVVAIGVSGPPLRGEAARVRRPPTVAQIAGVLLDAVMLDAIETDVEHSDRVNRSVLSCRGTDPANPFRWIDVLWLTPSVDFGSLAAELSEQVPPIVRYLLRGLGSDAAVSELLSYLLFAPAFTRRLIEAGRTDALAAKTEIRRFLAATADIAGQRVPPDARRRRSGT
jgi:NTE family protein